MITPRAAALLTITVVLSAIGAAQPDAQVPEGVAPQDFRPVLDRYCVSCHNDRLKTGGLVLNRADLSHIAQNAALWEKVVWKLRSASMPPIGLPRPDKATYDGLASALEHELDRAAIAAPCIDDLDHPAIELTKCPIASFAIVATQVLRLDKRPIKNPGGINKVDAMLEDIGLALGFVPFKVHSS